MPTTLERASRSAERLSEIKIPQLPLREHGLTSVPGIPLDFVGMIDQLIKLGGKLKQREQALQGLSTPMTIGGTTAPAYAFLFGPESADTQTTKALERVRAVLNRNPLGILSSLVDALKAQEKGLIRAAPAGADLTTRSLDDPTQWSMGWTTFPDARTLGLSHLNEWAATLDVTQPDKATEAFFPTIARYGRSYNLILTRKVKARDVGEWRALFDSAWTPALDQAVEAGLLYVIDLRIFETLKAQQVEGSFRFTPSTVTVLVQDAATKALNPELVRVAGGDNQPRVFSRRGSTTPSAWLYALQAAKVSVTVYGIWLGHVYHWHLVTAAMLMTMFENLSAKNPARKLLEPQSSHLIPFDGVLLLGWGGLAEVPPTSISTGWQFLELIDLFGKDRQFFDDDPTTTLEQLGIGESDFTVQEPWDQYPLVGDLLAIWTATSRYVNTYVDQMYPTDQDVQRDGELQRWIDASGRENDGNISGLPAMDSKEALKRVLHSLVYRILAHGGSRLYRSANPALTFVANFPPCLQNAAIPDPTVSFSTGGLAPLPSQHRHDRVDAPLLLHLLGDAHLRALRADQRNRHRPVLRRRGEQPGVDRLAPFHCRVHRKDRARHAADMAVGAPHRTVTALAAHQLMRRHEPCRPSRPPMESRSTTRTGARGSRSCSATAGRCRPMTGTRRCSSFFSRAIGSSRTTGAAMAAPLRPPTATTWTITPTTWRR